MAGKAFAIVSVDGKPYPAISKWSGGETQPRTREVPETNQAGVRGGGGTTREEPTGGVTRELIELEFMERADQDIFLDDLHAYMTKWRDEQNTATRRRAMLLEFYRDAEFKTKLGQLEVTGGWPKTVSGLEYDNSSDDARMFSATVTHLGSTYKKVGG